MQRNIVFWIIIVALVLGALYVLNAAGIFSPNGIDTPGNGQRSENIIVREPTQNSEVSRPLRLSGEARVFEATVNYRLMQADRTILAEGFTMTDAEDVGQFSPYEVLIDHPVSAQREGVLEVFQVSAEDGSEVDKVTINVRFRETVEEDTDQITLNVFFGDTTRDPANCDITYPAPRTVPSTEAVGRAALEQLLQGPTESEEQQGFFTSINRGVQINSLTIEDGVARVDFNETLDQNVGGSCRVSHIRAQITDTLTQFPTVDEVIISVDGRTEDILQP
jgi:hypothetical protein